MDDTQPKIEEHDEPDAEECEEHEVVEKDIRYDNSEDVMIIDGAAIEGCLTGKRKKHFSDDEPILEADSDYNNEDNIESSSEEKANSGKRRSVWKKVLPKFQEFRQDTYMSQPKLKLGLTFPSGKLFKDAIREHYIRSGKEVCFKVNGSNKV